MVRVGTSNYDGSIVFVLRGSGCTVNKPALISSRAPSGALPGQVGSFPEGLEVVVRVSITDPIVVGGRVFCDTKSLKITCVDIVKPVKPVRTIVSGILKVSPFGGCYPLQVLFGGYMEVSFIERAISHIVEVIAIFFVGTGWIYRVG